MKKIVSLIAILAVAGLAYGDSVRTWNGDDGGVVFRVKNSGTEKVTITVSSGLIVTVTNGSGVTSITGYGKTVDEIVASVAAATNGSLKETLTVDGNCSLAADNFTNVVAGTITIPANQHQWINGPKWDSSVALHFDTYYPAASKGGVGDPKIVSRLFGDCRGTGNITVVGYVDRTEVFSKILVSPIYVANVTGGGYTNALTGDDVTMGVFSIDPGIPVSQDESVMFRATRSTTATDFGGLGMVLDLKNN